VRGVAVKSISDVKAAMAELCLKDLPEEDAVVVLERAPFGKRNSVPAGQRGWVYLERFCSMVKIAMVDESEINRVVFSDSPETIAQILKGGTELREAAKMGPASLSERLQFFLSELQEKYFGATSIDKLCQTGGLGGDIGCKAALSDREIVSTIMEKLVTDLPSHWADQVGQQRQRLLVLAVNRGDATATSELLRLTADPNVQDTRGSTCLHTAVSRGDRHVAEILLLHGASRELQDAGGSTPAHLIPLWVSPATTEWFDLLVDKEVLSLMTNSGLSVFDRFWLWSETASKGQPFEEIQSRLRRLGPAPLEALKQRRVSKKRRRGSACALQTPESMSHSTFTAATGVPVHVWEPKGIKATTCIVILSMPITLPTSMQMSCWHDLAGAAVEEFDCKVMMVTTGGNHLPRSSLPLQDFLADLLVLIQDLPWKEPFLLVDNTTGAATSVLWPLRSRLLGALVINAAGYYSEEFLGSVASQKLAKVCQQRAHELLQAEGDPHVIVADHDITMRCAGSPRLFAEVHQQWATAATASDVEFWRQSAAQYQWAISEKTEALMSLPELTVTATLACSKHGPTIILTEAMRKLHALLPNSRLVHIEDSKCWWEIENPGFVKQELLGLLRTVTS